MKDKLIVKGGQYSEVINALLIDTFEIQQTLNQNWQMQFTAYDDHSLAFSLLSAQNSIVFDGQEYVIKQAQPNYQNGLNTVQITAVHIGYDVQRVYQHNINAGEKTYSVNDVLSFYLNGNNFGYSWKVIGDFDNQQIKDLGNGSGADMLSKIISTWDDAIFYPDNKCIQIFNKNNFEQNNGKVITYLGNSNTIQLTYDSTALANKVQCISEAKENSDSNNPQYYFQPFYVQDDDSIAKYGIYERAPLQDSRFHDENSMRTYALTQLQSEPTLSIQVTFNAHRGEDLKLGEIRRLIIPEIGLSTDIVVSQLTLYPLSDVQASQAQLNNTAKTILNYNQSLHSNINTTIDNSSVMNAAIQDAINSNSNEINKINQNLQTKNQTISTAYGSLSLMFNNQMIYVNCNFESLKDNTVITTFPDGFKPASDINRSFIISGDTNYIVNTVIKVDGTFEILTINDLTGKSITNIAVKTTGSFSFLAK